MTDENFFQDFDFCCNQLRNNVTLEKNRKKRQVVMYEPDVRRFSVSVINEGDSFLSPIMFCPYCGQRFLPFLEEKFSETIRRELGEEYLRQDDDSYDEFISRLPQEFQTDEWWKKRGL
jgi:hypothetical protein